MVMGDFLILQVHVDAGLADIADNSPKLLSVLSVILLSLVRPQHYFLVKFILHNVDLIGMSILLHCWFLRRQSVYLILFCMYTGQPTMQQIYRSSLFSSNFCYVFVDEFKIRNLIQVPWIQVSRSRSLLLMVKPAAFLVAVMMGAYVVYFVYFCLLIT